LVVVVGKKDGSDLHRFACLCESEKKALQDWGNFSSEHCAKIVCGGRLLVALSLPEKMDTLSVKQTAEIIYREISRFPKVEIVWNVSEKGEDFIAVYKGDAPFIPHKEVCYQVLSYDHCNMWLVVG